MVSLSLRSKKGQNVEAMAQAIKSIPKVHIRMGRHGSNGTDKRNKSDKPDPASSGETFEAPMKPPAPQPLPPSQPSKPSKPSKPSQPVQPLKPLKPLEPVHTISDPIHETALEPISEPCQPSRRRSSSRSRGSRDRFCDRRSSNGSRSIEPSRSSRASRASRACHSIEPSRVSRTSRASRSIEPIRGRRSSSRCSERRGSDRRDSERRDSDRQDRRDSERHDRRSSNNESHSIEPSSRAARSARSIEPSRGRRSSSRCSERYEGYDDRFDRRSSNGTRSIEPSSRTSRAARSIEPTSRRRSSSRCSERCERVDRRSSNGSRSMSRSRPLQSQSRESRERRGSRERSTERGERGASVSAIRRRSSSIQRSCERRRSSSVRRESDTSNRGRDKDPLPSGPDAIESRSRTSSALSEPLREPPQSITLQDASTVCSAVTSPNLYPSGVYGRKQSNGHAGYSRGRTLETVAEINVSSRELKEARHSRRSLSRRRVDAVDAKLSESDGVLFDRRNSFKGPSYSAREDKEDKSEKAIMSTSLNENELHGTAPQLSHQTQQPSCSQLSPHSPRTQRQLTRRPRPSQRSSSCAPNCKYSAQEVKEAVVAPPTPTTPARRERSLDCRDRSHRSRLLTKTESTKCLPAVEKMGTDLTGLVIQASKSGNNGNSGKKRESVCKTLGSDDTSVTSASSFVSDISASSSVRYNKYLASLKEEPPVEIHFC